MTQNMKELLRNKKRRCDEILDIKHGKYSEEEAVTIAEAEYAKLIGITNLGRNHNVGWISQLIYSEIEKNI